MRRSRYNQRELASSSLSYAQASPRERIGANRFPRDRFSGLILNLQPAAAPHFASIFDFVLPTATPITTEALARPRWLLTPRQLQQPARDGRAVGVPGFPRPCHQHGRLCKRLGRGAPRLRVRSPLPTSPLPTSTLPTHCRLTRAPGLCGTWRLHPQVSAATCGFVNGVSVLTQINSQSGARRFSTTPASLPWCVRVRYLSVAAFPC